MRRLLTVAVVALMLTMGCARADGGEPGAGAAASSSPAASRDAQIYTAVLRRYLTTPGDNSNLQFGTVFVYDYVDTDAADPMRTSNSDTATSIPPADQHAIATSLADLTNVQFVASRDEVVREKDGCPTVRDNGLLILLAPPEAAGAGFHVGIQGFAACLGATWLTYVVMRSADGWGVTGTVGPVAIS